MKTFGVKLRIKELKMPVWVKKGKMLVNRNTLEPNDPDSPYNYIKNLGLDPREFGYSTPRPSESDLNYYYREMFGVN